MQSKITKTGSGLLLACLLLTTGLVKAQDKSETQEVIELIASPELTAGDIMLYPNPVRDVLNISTQAHTPIEAIRIYNISGQLITYKKFSAAVESYDLNLADVPPGLYIIKMVSHSGTAVKRIVKS
jgi:hypothetical protein